MSRFEGEGFLEVADLLDEPLGVIGLRTNEHVQPRRLAERVVELFLEARDACSRFLFALTGFRQSRVVFDDPCVGFGDQCVGLGKARVRFGEASVGFGEPRRGCLELAPKGHQRLLRLGEGTIALGKACVRFGEGGGSASARGEACVRFGEASVGFGEPRRGCLELAPEGHQRLLRLGEGTIALGKARVCFEKACVRFGETSVGFGEPRRGCLELAPEWHQRLLRLGEGTIALGVRLG